MPLKKRPKHERLNPTVSEIARKTSVVRQNDALFHVAPCYVISIRFFFTERQNYIYPNYFSLILDELNNYTFNFILNSFPKLRFKVSDLYLSEDIEIAHESILDTVHKARDSASFAFDFFRKSSILFAE